MNGSYAPFDLDAFSNGYQQQSPQQQPQYQQGIAQPCYETYDPQHQQQPVVFDNRLYNSTGHHTVLQPAPVLGEYSLEADPLVVIQQQHRQQQQNATTTTTTWATASTTTTIPPTIDPHLEAFAHSFADDDDVILSPTPLSSMLLQQQPVQNHSRKISHTEEWLEKISIDVSGVSLEPMTGTQIVERVKTRTSEVQRRYLPCVDFLVSCQQELRAGLAAATQQRRYHHRGGMTPRQFYQRYLEPLGAKFLQHNHGKMEVQHLNQALAEIKHLCGNAKKAEYQGCEGMKNAFLGGMKDGESWGLRKWLSKHGGALSICNDLECILTAVQKMDRNAENTRRLAERLRPMAKRTFDLLKRDVPDSYQEQSSAHPYLPFFHRLECALRGVSNFDPEDDDVICIDDDDEVHEIKKKAASSPAKRKAEVMSQGQAKRRKSEIGESSVVTTTTAKARGPLHTIAEGGDVSDDDSDIEVVGVSGPGRKGIVGAPTPPPAPAAAPVAKKRSTQPLRCTRCTMLNAASSTKCCMCDQPFDKSGSYEVEEDNHYDDSETFSDFAEIPGMEETTATLAEEFWGTADGLATGTSTAISTSTEDSNSSMTADEMVLFIENLAFLFETNQQGTVVPIKLDSSCFWNSRVQYASALRLFASILQKRDAQQFLDPIDEVLLVAAGKPLYGDLIRHSICFRDICTALQRDGRLPAESTLKWNMWKGKDLLQAIDLVFVNSLAYNGKERTKQRSQTNALRKSLWDGINSTITSVLGDNPEHRRQCLPTRRGESSGFVVHKQQQPATPTFDSFSLE